LSQMARSAFESQQEQLAFAGVSADAVQRDPERWERIVMPGSKGLMVRTNEEFHVINILNTPAGLSYEGTPVSMLGTAASVMPLLSDVAEIPGESAVGWYDVESGVVEPAGQLESAHLQPDGTSQPAPQVPADWLNRALAIYFNDEMLMNLNQRFGARLAGEQLETDKPSFTAALVKHANPADLLAAALELYVANIASPAVEE
jgi:hypothetical protein